MCLHISMNARCLVVIRYAWAKQITSSIAINRQKENSAYNTYMYIHVVVIYYEQPDRVPGLLQLGLHRVPVHTGKEWMSFKLFNTSQTSTYRVEEHLYIMLYIQPRHTLARSVICHCILHSGTDPWIEWPCLYAILSFIQCHAFF